MAIHVLVIVTYCRPGKLLQSRRQDLIRPTRGLASDWSLLLHPVQRGVLSKTQSVDDTIDLRNQIYPWITKVAAVLAAGRPSERIFEYRYEHFTKEFRRATLALGLKDIVQYQCRHTGASQDKAGLHRTMLEIKKPEKMEVRQQHCAIRKIWKPGTDPVRSQQKSTNLLRSHETPSRGRFATLSDGGRFVLNLLSNGCVCRAAQRLGVRAAFSTLVQGHSR